LILNGGDGDACDGDGGGDGDELSLTTVIVRLGNPHGPCAIVCKLTFRGLLAFISNRFRLALLCLLIGPV
jgi:hypothetical protein